MSGKSSDTFCTYLTPLRVLRYRVAAADAAPGGSLPVVHLNIASRRPGSQPPATAGQLSSFGHNSVLMLHVGYAPSAPTYVLHAAPLADNSPTAHANISVWVASEVEGVSYGGTPDYTAVAPRWSLVHRQSVSCNTLIPLRDLPAAKYCVTVDFITAGGALDVGTVTIGEQHSE